MFKLIYTYSLVKALYEQGKDYIDSFWPFVLKVMPKDKTARDLVHIQKEVKEKFGLNIPQYSLKTIINRAKRRGYLIQKRKQYRLTDKGEDYLDNLEPESEVERRINELLEDIKNYLNEKYELSLNYSEIYEIVQSFTNENIYPVIEFFNPDSSLIQSDIILEQKNRYDGFLVNYFEIAKQKKPRFYKTLTDIVYGSVISTVVSTQNIAEINKKFGRTQIYLDSNYLFSILELHFPEFNKPAKELFNLLKQYKFNLSVFDFTIDEMVRVLKNYSKVQHQYIPDILVDSIYSSLKNQGFTVEDVREFIAKIEDRIWELGLKIESTTIELKDYKISENKYWNKIYLYKPEQNLLARNHDIAAIKKIREIRKSPKREIESSKALFLTSDLRLSRFNFLEMGHKEKYTISEVIPDRLFTTILWLKNPTIIEDIPLKSIIAIHSHQMFINRKIWRRFYENLTTLKENGSINNKDISMLFYDHHINRVLKLYDESKIDEITPNFIKEHIDIADNKISEKIKKKLEKQKEIFKKQLTQKELEKEKEFEAKLEKYKKKLKTEANKEARRNAIGIIFMPFFILCGISIYFYFSKGWQLISKVFTDISLGLGILSFLGIKLNIFNIRNYIQDKIFQKIYKKKLLMLEEYF